MADFLLAASVFFETHYIPVVAGALLALAALTLRRRSVLLLALLLAFVAVPLLKYAFADPRPCADGVAKIACPSDFGMPSAHAAVSAIFAIAALGSPVFYVLAPLGLFVSYSRIYLGVHSLAQVAGGVAMGISSYWLAASLHARFIRKGSRQFSGVKAQHPRSPGLETRRQAIHLVFGVFLVSLGIAFGKSFLIESLLAMLAGLLLLVHLRLGGVKVWFFELVLEVFERKDVELPGRGALHYLVGSLLVAAFARDFNFALAAIAILAVGDGLATLVGTHYGRIRLPWHRHKSLEGSAAFFAGGAVAAFPLVGFASLAYAFGLAVIESLPIDADDNLLVPLSAIALNYFAKLAV
ncbi:phosphatase PAP2 family protein [Candidatus Micrarchaeota archaeon]|nr:phosphatase PAP2 family protein [Candidatus Micrarchaeota archaeon]